MAKLSAHGTEIARLVTSRTEAAPEIYLKLHGITEQRYEYHYSFRSDGHILRRVVGLDTHPSEAEARYRRHDFGWKLWYKLEDPKRDTRQRMAATANESALFAEQRGNLIDFKIGAIL